MQDLGRDLLTGDFFVFLNRRRKRAKFLLWDGTGLCIYAKRLEHGRFACLWRDATAGPLRLTMSKLQLFLEGGALGSRVALSPAPFELAIASRAQKILASRADDDGVRTCPETGCGTTETLPTYCQTLWLHR
jgi:transposase